MCYCNPKIRTPDCGRPECYPKPETEGLNPQQKQQVLELIESLKSGKTADKEGGQSNAAILKYFEYAHLPEHLQKVGNLVSTLAFLIDGLLPDGPEKTAGLRKLLEAKDCFVRAAL